MKEYEEIFLFLSDVKRSQVEEMKASMVADIEDSMFLCQKKNHMSWDAYQALLDFCDGVRSCQLCRHISEEDIQRIEELANDLHIRSSRRVGR